MTQPNYAEQEERNAIRTPAPLPLSSCRHCVLVRNFARAVAGKRYEPQLKVLASLQRQLCFCLARYALQSQHHLLCSLCLLLEHWLRLSSVPGLFAVITSFPLREQRCLWETEELAKVTMTQRVLRVSWNENLSITPFCRKRKLKRRD